MRTRQRTSDGTEVFPVLMRWVACLLATASPALACPTGADLADGIAIKDDDDTTEVYRKGGGNTVVVDVTYSDGFQAQNTFIHGVYLRQLADVIDGVVQVSTALSTSYASDPPEPAAGASGILQTKVGSPVDGFVPEVQGYAWNSAATYQIGACTYAAIQGTLTYKSDGIDVTETVEYIPELGIGLLTEYAEVGFDTDRYIYTDIFAK